MPDPAFSDPLVDNPPNVVSIWEPELMVALEPTTILSCPSKVTVPVPVLIVPFIVRLSFESISKAPLLELVLMV